MCDGSRNTCVHSGEQLLFQQLSQGWFLPVSQHRRSLSRILKDAQIHFFSVPAHLPQKQLSVEFEQEHQTFLPRDNRPVDFFLPDDARYQKSISNYHWPEVKNQVTQHGVKTVYRSPKGIDFPALDLLRLNS